MRTNLINRTNLIKRSAFAVLLCALLLSVSACGGAGNRNNGGGSELTNFKLTAEYFSGKSVVVYGDSITANVASYLDDQPDYIEILGNTLGFNFFRYAVGGSRLTENLPPNGRRSGVSIIADNAFTNRRVDYAIIAYGTNDFGARAELGEDDDDPESVDGVDTFKGAINYSMKLLRAHNPKMKVLMLTPIFRSDHGLPTPNIAGVPLTAYGDAFKSLAAKWEYRVVDMYVGLFDAVNFLPGGALTNDGLHPNGAGHRMMADHLLAWDK